MRPRQHHVLPAPLGVATSVAPTSLKETHAATLSGFYGARLGECLPVSPLHPVYIAAETTPPGEAADYNNRVSGLAEYRPAYHAGAFIALMRDAKLYPLTIEFSETRNSDGVFVLQASAVTVGPALTTAWFFVGPISSAQYNNELFMASHPGGDNLGRYYYNTTTLAYVYKDWGIPTPTSAPTVNVAAGSTLTGTFSYKFCLIDELNRYSSPSPSVSTGAITTKDPVVSLPGSGYVSGGTTGVTEWAVCRTTNGGSIYYVVAEVAIGTTSYTDTMTDATLVTQTLAPIAGQNNPPPTDVGYTALWRNRVVCAPTYSTTVYISNDKAPTQFSTVGDSAIPTDGCSMVVDDNEGGYISGLVTFGSVVLILTTSGAHVLSGTDLRDFDIDMVQPRGCWASGSIAASDNAVFWLSEDGVYRMRFEGGYIVENISEPIQEELRGMIPTGLRLAGYRTGETLIGSYSLGYIPIHGWVHGNRYNLAVGTKTWSYDTLSGQWCELGFGLVTCSIGGRTSQQPYTLIGLAKTMDHLGASRLYCYSEGVTLQSWVPAPPVQPTQRVRFRPFDGAGIPESRLKRAEHVRVWGDANGARGPIGRLHVLCDGATTETYPIDTRLTTEPGMLVDQQCCNTQGRILQVELEFDTPVTLGRAMMEYTPAS